MCPFFYNPDVEVARKVAAACVAGGCPLLEFTNRGDHGLEVFSELERYCAKELPNLILGVGSIVDAGTASLYINCGANFVVGPCRIRKWHALATAARSPIRRAAAVLRDLSGRRTGLRDREGISGKESAAPGCQGCQGAVPWVSIMPTGGVECYEASLKAWFDAGVACVGMGSNLITKDLLKAGNYEGIADKVRETLEIVRKVRAK